MLATSLPADLVGRPLVLAHALVVPASGLAIMPFLVRHVEHGYSPFRVSDHIPGTIPGDGIAGRILGVLFEGMRCVLRGWFPCSVDRIRRSILPAERLYGSSRPGEKPFGLWHHKVGAVKSSPFVRG